MDNVPPRRDDFSYRPRSTERKTMPVRRSFDGHRPMRLGAYIVSTQRSDPKQLTKTERTLDTQQPRPKISGQDVRKFQPKPKRSTPTLPRQARSQVLHRSSFGPKVIQKTRARIRRSRHHQLNNAPIVLTALILIGVCVIGFSVWRVNRQAAARVAVLGNSSGQADEGLPSEVEPEPGSHDSYQVAADLPRYLRIPKIQVDAAVKRLGVKDDNELRAPSNIFDVGWYEGSSKPGENGTVLLDGHVSGPTKQGVFYYLSNLKPDDKLEIERGDGRVIHYKVVKLQVYEHDKVDMKAALTSAIPGKPGLNLITGSGRFDVKTNKFEQRTVVFAVRDQ